ncbi:AAA-domain-containing protein [Syncephalis fuscata]|nr:AAA-domain-containing protein [Syncephalis fuscata]
MKLTPTAQSYLLDIAMLVVAQVTFYYGFKYFLKDIRDPKRKDASAKGKKVAGRLGFSNISLTSYEEIIMSEVVHPDDINIHFKDIGGLDPIIQELNESVIYPLAYPQLFTSASGLLGAPKGVLLYGEPGCGKTMIAKALAKESGATFINMHISTLTDKWFGESNKLVSALFSLARKLEPSIIFIDEIDSFLRSRRSTDHETTATMKAEFMSLWDGLVSSEGSRILVLGATNRPDDIDTAILRRMPKRFSISPPDESQRTSILNIMLKDIKLSSPEMVSLLAKATEGFTGSDLKELCRNAAMIPVRERVRTEAGKLDHGLADLQHMKYDDVRPLVLQDFIQKNKYDGTVRHTMLEEPQD